MNKFIEILNNDKFIELFKWFIGSVVIVVVTFVIETGFKERQTGIEEIDVYNNYIDIILNVEDIEQRWRLVEYFSVVTPTPRLRERWIEYKRVIEPNYYEYKNLQRLEENILNQSQIAVDSLVMIQSQMSQLNVPMVEKDKSTVAGEYERLGFQCLVEKDVVCAIENFKQAEESYNGYHQVYDIYIYLLKNKSNTNWEKVYKDVLTKYSWKIPIEYKNQISGMSGE